MPSPERWAASPYKQRLAELGWNEGANVVIRQARAEGHEERLPALAAELVREQVDLILTQGPEAAVAAARATKTIPIVFWGVTLPAELGLVASLARPGGNVTGVAWNAGGEVQAAKTLELLRQMAPAARRVATIFHRASTTTVTGPAYTYPAFGKAAESLGLILDPHGVRDDSELDAVFAAITAAHADALAVITSPLTARNRQRIAEFASRQRLPSAFDHRAFVEAGGLVSYGPDGLAIVRRSIDYVDRILRGARPRDLPVELPTRFELVVNAKTARALGLTVPRGLLLQADEVID
nr:ABC transporter substrate-binding protein [Aquabacterium terrae]